MKKRRDVTVWRHPCTFILCVVIGAQAGFPERRRTLGAQQGPDQNAQPGADDIPESAYQHARPDQF